MAKDFFSDSTARTAATLESAGMRFMGGDASNEPLDTTYAMLLEAIFAALLTDTDTTIFSYTSASSITVAAGGQFSDSGLTALYNVAAATVVSTSADLSASATGAPTLQNSTFYYLWGGEDSGGALTFVFSDLTTLPSELSKGRILRGGIAIDGSGNILSFSNDGLWYHFTTSINVYTGTMPTTNTSIDMSAYVPADVRRATFRVGSTSFASPGAFLTGVAAYVNDISCIGDKYLHVGSSYVYLTGVFQSSVTQSFNWRTINAYTSGNLWLEGFKL